MRRLSLVLPPLMLLALIVPVSVPPVAADTAGATDEPSVIVDDGDDGYTEHGQWATSNVDTGYGGSSRYSQTPTSTATWALEVAQTGRTTIFAFLQGAGAETTTSATYQIEQGEVSSTVTIDQRRQTSGWVRLHSGELEAGTVTVTLEVGSGAVHRADAMGLSSGDAAGPPPTVGNWSEMILADDGSLDADAYEAVAEAYDAPDIVDYRLGPRASDYGTPTTAPTLPQRGSEGFFGDRSAYEDGDWTNWYAMSGPLPYVSDDADDGGLARARNGSIYLSSRPPGYLFDQRPAVTPDKGNGYSRPRDPALDSPAWVEAAGGAPPSQPVAVARSHTDSIYSVVAFADGLVGVTGNGNDPNTRFGRYPVTRLAPGQVPTAVAITPGAEFALVTVWDTNDHQGKVAVLALQGAVHAQTGMRDDVRYGFPSWADVRGIKLLGTVDLGFAAPVAIAASTDITTGFSRGDEDNDDLNLDQQSERDTWFDHSGGRWQRTARAGYAVVASRAEGKVAFLDLEPLLAYYRQMYFTTQERYDQTKDVGPAGDQWPYTFDQAPEQRPVLSSTLGVPAPTAVGAGFNRPPSFNFWRSPDSIWDEDIFGNSAYVATMSGTLIRFDVDRLNKVGDTGEPTQMAARDVGRGLTSIDYSTQFDKANDLVVTSRGDRRITRLTDALSPLQTLRDSRIADPVSVGLSRNGRGDFSSTFTSVVDHDGKRLLNYATSDDGYQWGFTLPLPGKPLRFLPAEVL